MLESDSADFSVYVRQFGDLERHNLEALRIMWDDASGDLSVERIAKRLFMSSSNFARRFKRNVKRPPMAVWAEIRIVKAKPLVAEGRLPIKEIAIDGGWLRQGSFSRCFKRACGLAPTQYRKSGGFVSFKIDLRGLLSHDREGAVEATNSIPNPTY